MKTRFVPGKFLPMRFFKNMVLGFVFLAPFVLQAQDTLRAETPEDDRAVILKTLEEYLEAGQAKNYDRVLDFIHPTLFKAAPREALLEHFQAMDRDTQDFTTDFGEGTILKMSDIFEEDGNKYILMDYNFEMLMHFKNMKTAADYLDLYKKFYGAEQVTFDAATRTIKVVTKKSMYGIFEPGFDTWKFIENNENQAFLLESIVPKTVIEKIKNQKK